MANSTLNPGLGCSPRFYKGTVKQQGKTHKATDPRLRVQIVVLASTLLSSGCSEQDGHLLQSKGP